MANKNSFDINEMAIFVEVVNAQSFTGAANNLGLPKSTISRKITQLEEHLGVRLLQRTTRTLHLTDSGSAYYNHCAQIISDIKEANIAITQMQSTPSGTIRLTAPVLFGSEVLASLITEFLTEYPEINIDMMLSDQVVDIVQEGCDLAFRVGDLADSSLIARRLGETALTLVATPEYLQKNGVPTQPQDLTSHHAISFSRMKNWDFHTASGENTNVNVNARIISNDIHCIHKFILSGLGIGKLPSLVCADDIKAGRLKPLLCDWMYGTSPIHVVYPSNRHLSIKVRAFVDFIVERLREDAPWDNLVNDKNDCKETDTA
jgi:DNA-binding transcriptional LysR family regulator